MNKRDLIRAVAEKTGKPMTVVDVILEAAFAQITDALEKGDTVAIGGFGSFALGAKPPKKKATA